MVAWSTNIHGSSGGRRQHRTDRTMMSMDQVVSYHSLDRYDYDTEIDRETT